METSARNQFKGTVAAIRPGAVHDEIELTANNGITIIASITKTSTAKLGLSVGKEAIALVKASMVTLLTGADNYILSTRNQFTGTVKETKPGVVNAEVILSLENGTEITSVITMSSLQHLNLRPGIKATAIFKAPSVILAVKK